MRSRTALFAALAVAVAATTPAMAATKKKPKPLPKVCYLFTDAKGDGAGGPLDLFESDALDVHSADIATGPTEFVAVLRLASTNPSGDTYKDTGYSWFIQADGGGIKYNFDASRDSMLQPASVGEYKHSVRVGDVSVPHQFIVGTNTLTWKFKRKGIANLAKPKLMWTNINAGSKHLSSSADTGNASEKKYFDRQRSCVVAK